MAAKYSAGQDYMSAAKLNYFHYVLKQLMGYILHPSIKNPSHIADLGTQTGIWPIDVAESFENVVEVDAYDLSDKFVPPAAWLPKKVHFKVHDVTTPFPSDALAKYDVVHFRLFLTLSVQRLTDMLAAAMPLLKPGGYIQWTEHDKTNLEPITAGGEGASTEAVEAFIHLQQNPFPGYNARWVNEIAPAMTAAGLEVVAEERIKTKPAMLNQLHELHLMSLMDVAPGLSAKVDEFKEKYFDTLAQDHGRGIALMDGFICVVGRKPV